VHESPSVQELLEGVIAFLNDVATPNLTGSAQFHARVSANALALVARELTAKDDNISQTLYLYNALLGTHETDLDALQGQLSEAIRTGQFGLDTPGLMSALRTVTQAQLLVDQPNYSGLKP
jgi:hypothetical protein